MVSILFSRELLLEYGAQEGKEENLRWLICQGAANLAHHRREAFYGDDHDLSPCGAAMERATSDETLLDSMRGEKSCLLHVSTRTTPTS